MSSLLLIRRRYRVPAHHGARVKVVGGTGTIIGADPQRDLLRVKLDHSSRIALCDPTWHIQYLDAGPGAIHPPPPPPRTEPPRTLHTPSVCVHNVPTAEDCPQCLAFAER